MSIGLNIPRKKINVRRGYIIKHIRLPILRNEDELYIMDVSLLLLYAPDLISIINGMIDNII